MYLYNKWKITERLKKGEQHKLIDGTREIQRNKTNDNQQENDQKYRF